MKNIIQSILILVITFQTVNAQNSDTKRADKHFERLEFVDAIEDYEKLISKGKADAYVFRQLAIANYNILNSDEAAVYYKQYLKMDENASKEDYFNYAQILMSNKEYDKAKEAYQNFANKAPNDSRAKAFMNNPDFANDLLSMTPNYEINAMELNSEYSDFGGYESSTSLYFTSSRNQSRRTYGWNEQPTTDIYVAENVAGTFKNEELLKGDINSKYNEGTIAITNDGQTIYFTRNNYVDGDYETSEAGRSKLRIYTAKLINGVWQDIKPLPFTGAEYEVAHPALSPDNSTLYFSSDMDGGYGESDLYMVSINEDGSFGQPQNLGNKINTEGRESFPFVDADGNLFFSSNGHLGLGGLDVYYVNMSGQSMSAPKNLGAPVNSAKDDFAFTYFNQVGRGYVSSNRGDNPLNDNIYQTTLIKPLDETNLMVTVLNMDTNEPLANADVIIYDDKDNQVFALRTDEDGLSEQNVISDMEYDVQGNLTDFESASETLIAQGVSMDIELRLKPVEKIIVDREITVSNIFFEYDKSEIRPEAAFELDKLAETLMEYPDLKIKIESYADSRGTESYNQSLSEARAESTKQYLVDKGIDASRLSTEGLGETNPVNDCSNGCTEEEYEENRRSKFIIVE